MLKLAGVLLIVLFCVISCNNSNNETSKPSDLLDKGKMAAVLTDLTLMESASNTQVILSGANKVNEDLKFNIFKQHLITRKQYETSLYYYSANTNEFKEVYEIVLQNLNKQKGN